MALSGRGSTANADEKVGNDGGWKGRGGAVAAAVAGAKGRLTEEEEGSWGGEEEAKGGEKRAGRPGPSEGTWRSA